MSEREKTVKLRPYQQQQLNFADWRLEVANTVGIESPTGSGKTYVILELARQWLEKNPLTNVVITTGFNNLVFLMEKRANALGMEPLVLIGTKALNCPVEWEVKHPNESFRCFTETRECVCGKKHLHLDTEHKNPADKVCPYTIREYRNLFNQIQNGSGKLIITNHSSFLAHQATGLWNNVSLLIVDEAHTMSTYYDTWVQLELDVNDLRQVDQVINKLKPPMNMVVKRNIQNGKMLPMPQVNALTSMLSGSLKEKVREFFTTKPAPNVWVEAGPDGYVLDRFYRQFDMERPKTVLFSATLDDFTLRMFKCRKADLYQEKTAVADYSKSEFIAIPRKEFKPAYLEFLEYVSSKGLKYGLCLSTTIADMKIALEQDGYRGFKATASLSEFIEHVQSQSSESMVLCGSRALFQGVDIPGVQFVCLNRIPFPNWNDKAKAQQDYITDHGRNGIDAWGDFVVPKTENDILQSSGRLWRGAESEGVVACFDDRCDRFAYMFKHCFYERRKGITMLIMDQEHAGEVREWTSASGGGKTSKHSDSEERSLDAHLP